MSLTRKRRRPAVPPSTTSTPQPRATPAVAVAAVAKTTVVERKKSRQMPHWQQTERWFWLTSPHTEEQVLVKPSGQTHEQGPFEMVQFTTQDGALKACTLAFFEANTRPWIPGTTR